MRRVCTVFPKCRIYWPALKCIADLTLVFPTIVLRVFVHLCWVPLCFDFSSNGLFSCSVFKKKNETKGLCVIGLLPVSYTHLDVYKRQILLLIYEMLVLSLRSRLFLSFSVTCPVPILSLLQLVHIHFCFIYSSFCLRLQFIATIDSCITTESFCVNTSQYVYKR